MAKHWELCLVLITLFLTFLSNYGSSFKSKPLVIPARMPQPLFPGVSSVMDLYLGDLRPLVDMLHKEDLIFVMYYAPWCAKSSAVKSQFMRAAQFLEGQVPFVAVNCWYPEGLCRKQYKFLLYPVFFAYHRNNDGYRYMGIERAEFMVKFLEDLLHPLTLLGKLEQVKDFMIQHDTVVVGYFDFNSSPQPPGFQQFYYAAMRVVEHDPYQPVKFGVVTDPDLAILCHLTQPSEIVFLRINNSTLKFPFPNNITSTNIINWVFSGRHQLPVRWIVPLGMKSLVLSREIEKGPAVIMFHRVSPLSPASQPFSMFKDLALRYNQCPGDNMAQDTTRRWLAVSIWNVIQHAQALNSCRSYKISNISATDAFKCCISTTHECRNCLPEAKLNVCEICQHWSSAQHYRPSVCSFKKSNSARHGFASVSFFPSNSCQNSISSYDVSSHTSVCCKRCNRNISSSDFLTASSASSTHYQASDGRRLTDRYVIESLENLPRKLCNRLAFQKSQEAFPSAIIPDFGSSALPPEFTGRGCQANRTLSFISLDSQNHWMFAKSLGLDVSQAHLSPVIVLFDKEKEEQLVLKEKFSKKNTASFILNFTKGFLKRELRSVPSERQENCAFSPPSLCVTELTTETFQAAINQPKDLVLLVYAGWCGFCAAVSHVFLHLAHYFHTSSNITFARINGETNDLPWEFSMESYPTIIFFPAFREADSVAFPDNVTPSLPNLIRFVLQHTTFTTRLHLAADICSAACVHENLDLCRHTARALRSKLHRLQSRLRVLPFTSDHIKVSHYHSALEKILKGKIDDIQSELKEIKALREFLENSRGKHLDHTTMEAVLYEKMRWKDLSARR